MRKERLDLTGKRFGQLEVLHADGEDRYGGRLHPFWSCHCHQCGRDERVAQKRLGDLSACSICSRGPCVVCSGEITRKTRSNVCSDTCQRDKRRATYLKHYRKLCHEDPLHNQKRHLAVVARMDADPEFAAHIRQIRQEASARYRNKPDKQAQIQAYQQERWQAHKAQIRVQRQRFWNSLSDSDKETRQEKHRSSWRNYQRRYRQWLRSNPDEQKKYQGQQRQWRVERARQQALADLLAGGLQLQEKLNNE